MNTAQSELPLSGSKNMPELAAEGAVWLIAFLAANPEGPGPGGAWPGRKICEQIGRPFDEKSRRLLRAFRESAGSVIVSGPRGYQHVSHCTVEDRRKAAEIRLAQGQKMARDAIRELRALKALAAISRTPPAGPSRDRCEGLAKPLRDPCEGPANPSQDPRETASKN